MKILVVNGPNLNLLGVREPEFYGQRSYRELEDYIGRCAAQLGLEVEIFQSNYEGALVEKIQSAWGTADGLVINAAAYTHTSVALLDALKAVGLPAVEVHLTNPERREPFRRLSYVGMACEKRFAGFGFEGYRMALQYLAGRESPAMT